MGAQRDGEGLPDWSLPKGVKQALTELKWPSMLFDS